MPDVKISQLPAATTPLAGTEQVAIVQGGVTARATVADTTADKASLSGATFTGTAVFGAGTNIALTGAAGSNRISRYRSGSLDRWACLINNVAESGANVGSDYLLNRYSDAGTFIATVLQLSRATGDVLFGQDNVQKLGGPSNRANEFFCGNATINTSDAREKTNIRPLNEQELAAAIELARAVKIFQWKTSVAEKGDDARLHCSQTVQDVMTIMQSHGLDPFRYGFVCFDEWEALPEVWNEWPAQDEVRDPETDEVLQEAMPAGRELVQAPRPAGNRYGLRSAALASFIDAGVVQRQDALEARLDALESD